MSERDKHMVEIHKAVKRVLELEAENAGLRGCGVR